MKTLLLFTIVLVESLALTQPRGAGATEIGKHIFILSGQSNMQGHRPEEAFAPAVKVALGEDKVIVIQDALGGQPIQRWWKDWKSPEGENPKQTGDLYDRLMGKVMPKIKGQTLNSVTFIWMQGERDAKMQWAEVYEASLKGLYDQLSKDLGRSDINFVIGRLSDFDLKNRRYPHWTMVRKIQVKLAESNPRFDWVNTDDLNDGVNRKGIKIQNDLHYSAEGYKTLGKRFAESALKLIKKDSPTSSSNSVVVSSSISYVDKDKKGGELYYKNTNGQVTLKVVNSDGKVVFDGPANTKEQKSQVPTEAMKWLEKVNIKVDEVNIKIKPPAVN